MSFAVPEQAVIQGQAAIRWQLRKLAVAVTMGLESRRREISDESSVEKSKGIASSRGHRQCGADQASWLAQYTVMAARSLSLARRETRNT